MNKITEIMDELGLSSVEMAKELGVTSSLIYMLSTGTRTISDKMAMMISHKFGYNQDWILGSSSQKFANKKDQDKLAQSKKNVSKINQNQVTDRIIELINHLWLNKKIKNESEFCRRIGYEQSSFAMIKAKKRMFPLSKIPTIVETFKISSDWLLYGNGEIYNYPNEDSNYNNHVSEPESTYQTNEKHNANNERSEGVPFYDVDVAASAGVEMFNDKNEMPNYHYNVPGFEDCDFAVPVFGHSMYPTYENGTVIMCKKINDKTLIIYGEAYLVVTKDYRMVKRLQKSENKGSVIACSDNEEERDTRGKKKYEPFEIPIDKIIHLYLIKGVIKRNQL